MCIDLGVCTICTNVKETDVLYKTECFDWAVDDAFAEQNHFNLANKEKEEGKITKWQDRINRSCEFE